MVEYSQPLPTASDNSAEIVTVQSLTGPAPPVEVHLRTSVAEDSADIDEEVEGNTVVDETDAQDGKFIVCSVQSGDAASFVVEPSTPSADPLSCSQQSEFIYYLFLGTNLGNLF